MCKFNPQMLLAFICNKTTNELRALCTFLIFYRHNTAFTTALNPNSIREHAVSVPSLYLSPYIAKRVMTGNCWLTVTRGGICMKRSAIICTVMVDNNLSHRLTAVTANAPLITSILCWDRDVHSQSLWRRRADENTLAFTLLSCHVQATGNLRC